MMISRRKIERALNCLSLKIITSMTFRQQNTQIY